MKPTRTSASRVWCKICRVWIANNKNQRDSHDESTKHKTAAAALVRDIAHRNKGLRVSQPAPVTTNRVRVREAHSRMFETVARAVAGEARFETSNSVHFQPVHVDEDGFPLPAQAMYGAWLPVETEEPLEAVQGAPDECSRVESQTASEKTTAAVSNSILQSEAPKTERNRKAVKVSTGESSDASIAIADGIAREQDAARIQIEGSFKRRRAPGNRRKRKAKNALRH